MLQKLRLMLVDGFVSELSLDQLRGLAERFGYELRRKLRWTDGYQTHSPTYSTGEVPTPHRDDYMQQDQARIRNLLKKVPKSGNVKKPSFRTTTDCSESFNSRVRPGR